MASLPGSAIELRYPAALARGGHQWPPAQRIRYALDRSFGLPGRVGSTTIIGIACLSQWAFAPPGIRAGMPEAGVPGIKASVIDSPRYGQEWL
jgi:hypothetical protein